jgi:hypothetical protein
MLGVHKEYAPVPFQTNRKRLDWIEVREGLDSYFPLMRVKRQMDFDATSVEKGILPLD